ncbi:PAS-domain containing protein [Puniceibacterium sediminis]|uniref:PAS-domain containing protein n=1 Tax=Puniceibacterium sediminis TaxID=1608407 RepID=UPI001FEA85DB|nr:PAS-domain containing protein [Puniceibacterium sediminis]
MILFSRNPKVRTVVKPTKSDDDIVFLMRSGRIYSASDSARQLLTGIPFDDAEWQQIHKLLVAVFPDLPAEEPKKSLVLHAKNQPECRLAVQPDIDGLRVELFGPAPSPAEMTLCILQSAELDMLRVAMASIASPFWESDAQGRVIWANAAYRDLCDKIGTEQPDAALFDIAMPKTPEPTRCRTSISDTARENHRWFEITSRQSNGTWLHHGIDIDAVVRAETAQRNFLQTLTKTFAYLPIGLAVFDRNRQLALFNPALIDLTSLSADFLTGRPNLLSFFDHMRENRMMPEPKSYSGWREQMAELVAAASDDRYSEVWSLPSGLTYKITGRPHPDGAIAFLIEDISAEISLTRRFRAEMELNQSVLDAFDHAVAVFSHLGVLTFCNTAYRELWNTDPDSTLAEMTVLDATLHWQSSCEASPIWPELRDFVLDGQDRATWDAELTLRNGMIVDCTVEPVSGGATVVCFKQSEQRMVSAPPRLRLTSEG